MNYKRNSIRKIYRNVFLLTGVAIAFVTIQSCADLDPDVGEFDAPPGVIDTQEALEANVIGLYGLLRQAAVQTTFFASAWAGDDMTTFRAGNKQDFRQFDQRNVTAANNRLTTNWRNMYDIINNATITITRSDFLLNLAADDDSVDEVTIRNLLGEVYFLRAFAYNHLIRTHEKLPIIETFPESNFNALLSSRTDVFAQIEADFLQAEELLPTINETLVVDGATRPNKGSARALLSRVYLDWAGFPVNNATKYAQAAEVAKKAMDEAASHGFSLVDDTEDLWKIENRFNKESVFTIAFNPNLRLPNQKYNQVGYPGDFGGWDETFAEVRFFEEFPEGARKEATYRTDLDWKNLSGQKNPIFKKVTGPKGDVPNNLDDGLRFFFNTERNDFYMRYAEVLLNYAEASGRAGMATGEAWEALNMVRRRAAGLPFDTAVTSPTAQLDVDGNPIAGLTYVDVTTGDLAELAFTERKWEFAGEYLRWNDLVRTEKVSEALSNRTPVESFDDDGNLIIEANDIRGSVGTDNYFSPIPQAILDENPALRE